MRLEWWPEKTCKKKPRGKNMAGNLGRNRGSGSKQPILRGFTIQKLKNSCSDADSGGRGTRGTRGKLENSEITKIYLKIYKIKFCCLSEVLT